MILSIDLCSSNFMRLSMILNIAFEIVCILIPIIISITVIIPLFKIIISDGKISDVLSSSVKKIIAGIIILLLPTIFNFIFSILINKDIIPKCLENVTLSQIENQEAKEAEEREEENAKEKQALEEAIEKKESEEAAEREKIKENNKKLGTISDISIEYHVKDSEGRCGIYKTDYCAEVATVTYTNGNQIKYYMGYQNNHNLLGGSCRSHAFVSALNAMNNTYYSTLDLQEYLYTAGYNGVLKGASAFNSAINYFDVDATAYFDDISISEAIDMAEENLNEGKPVIIFVAHSKCSDLAGSHHALLLLGYDEDGNVIFLDSCARYKSAKKRNLEQLEACMSGDSVAKSWMRMVIYN